MNKGCEFSILTEFSDYEVNSTQLERIDKFNHIGRLDFEKIILFVKEVGTGDMEKKKKKKK